MRAGGQPQQRQVVGQHLQQRQRQVARLGRVVLRQRHLGLQEAALRLLGQRRRHVVHQLGGGVDLLPAEGQPHQQRAGVVGVGVDHQRLLQQRLGLVGLAARQQHLGLQQQGLGGLGVAQQLLVQRGQRLVGEAGGQLGAGPGHDGAFGLGCQLQRPRRHGPRLGHVALREISHRQVLLQRGHGLRVGQALVGELGNHLARLPGLQQRLRQQRRQLVARRAQLPAAPQLDLGARHVAGLQQRLAQQVPRLRVVGVLLQQVLQLDDGAGGVLLFQPLPGRGQQLRLRALAAGGQRGGQQDRCEMTRLHRFSTTGARLCS